MERLNLAGEWQLSQDGKPPIPGRLPGCTYLDYMANGLPDPFFGENEEAANELARHNYRYSRQFELDAVMLNTAALELVADGVDTLCTIFVNGQEMGCTDNINRTWRLNVKPACHEGKNRIDLDFANPYAAMEALQLADPLTKPMNPVDGVGHLRKTPSHFGWDWGPKLPPAGVVRSIGLESYSLRVEEVRVRQRHENSKVKLDIEARLDGHADAGTTGSLTLCAPSGDTTVHTTTVDGAALHWKIMVDKPELWWCNGLGKQPLYGLEVVVAHNGVEADRVSRRIGLRTIGLDTAPDQYGNQFRFVINGIPIFAKGANWIPPDSFATRADRETMYFYVEAARRANMNMLRVWGGGMMESDDFYDACDENGILVWQDFIFACNPYPLYNEAFVANVRAEEEDNVRRLRHRACLALWCGNNENEVFIKSWKKSPKLTESNPAFYHRTLREWVEELDGVTPYWPGSPSSGFIHERPYNMKEGETKGDTHLWQIWHGMRPIEAFRNYPTRFCSEYGMESMPAMHTVRGFTDNPSPQLFDPVMQLHQKCPGGNEKMLFYLLAKYRNPAAFEDFVYLSQLVQADTVRFATDCWRRNMGRQNGALFWQLNDCWPVASWAGIDYGRQLKAVMYQARHFNKPLCLSNDYFKDRAEIYVANEYPNAIKATLEWSLEDFNGGQINRGSQLVEVGGTSSVKALILRFAAILKGRKKSQAALTVRLLQNGAVRDEKAWLLVPDRLAALPDTKVGSVCQVQAGVATVELTADRYARHVYLEAEGVVAPWSDNFFDIPAGGRRKVAVRLPQGMNAEEFARRLHIKTLADVKPKNSRLKDRWLRVQMFMSNKNWLYWILFKIIFG